MVSVRITPATPKDAAGIMELIKELAEFEKMPEGVKITESQLEKDIEKEAVCGLLLWEEDKLAAMVLYYFAYSTWEGQYIHMEDLYVRLESRRKKYGQKLWVELGKVAKSRGCRRLQWNVLDWNKSAINFYKTMPYQNLTESEGWLSFRLDFEGIEKLATSLQ